jgi:hypothetical protein
VGPVPLPPAATTLLCQSSAPHQTAQMGPKAHKLNLPVKTVLMTAKLVAISIVGG